MGEPTENTQALHRLTLQLEKQNSFMQSFLKGLVTALGATIGLSLFLAVVLVIVNFVAQALGLQGLLDPLVTFLKK